MNDEIVDEIHQIRACLYQETKDMTFEERKAKAHAASEWVQQQIAECRGRKVDGQPSVVNRQQNTGDLAAVR